MSEPRPSPRSVNIAEVLCDARLGDLRWLAENRTGYDDLESTTQALLDLLAERKVEFVLVGGLAMLQYVDGRNTRDIDLIMALADLRRLPELIIESHDGDFARANYRGVQIDLLLTSNKLFDAVKRNYTTRREFSGRPLPVTTPEGLVLLKLFALPSLYRQGDAGRVGIYENDVYTLLEREIVDIEAVRAHLRPHLLPSDLIGIDQIVAELQTRIQRVRSGGGFGGP